MIYFRKKHLVIKKTKQQFINPLIQGYFGIYFLESGSIEFIQYKALLFFLKKRLKFCSKIFLRVSNSLKRTSKSIGVRMGKGKGSLDNFYIPVECGQVFIEFFFNNNLDLLQNTDFLNKIKKIILLFSKKINLRMSLIKK